MDRIGRLSDVDVAADAPMRDMAQAPEAEEQAAGGFLARLLSGGGDEATAPAAAAEPETAPETAAAPATNAEPGTAAKPAAETDAATGDKGRDQAETRVAAQGAEPKGRGGRGGFFGFGRAPAPAVQSDIAFGTVLPYGQLAVICDVPTRKMGKKIASFPERRETFALYDSDPGNTAPHSFYLTGFDDGCARQFTASLAVFGSVAMHEQLRYGLPAEVQPYSDTDKAYEALKSKVCRVPRREPCGQRLSRLERDTVFVSIYERFGGNARWKNLLLHDGDVLAQDIKGG